MLCFPSRLFYLGSFRASNQEVLKTLYHVILSRSLGSYIEMKDTLDTAEISTHRIY